MALISGEDTKPYEAVTNDHRAAVHIRPQGRLKNSKKSISSYDI